MLCRLALLLALVAILTPTTLAAETTPWDAARTRMAALDGMVQAQETHALRPVAKAAGKAAAFAAQLAAAAEAGSLERWFEVAPKAVARMAKLAKKAAKAGDAQLAANLTDQLDLLCHVSRDLLIRSVGRLKEERPGFEDNVGLLRAISTAERGVDLAEELHEAGRPVKKVVKRLAWGSRLIIQSLGR